MEYFLQLSQHNCCPKSDRRIAGALADDRPSLDGNNQEESSMRYTLLCLFTVSALLFAGSNAFADIGGPSGGNTTFTTTTTNSTITHTTTVNQQEDQFSVELLALLAGGSVVFDQTFDKAYSDPIVQAAVSQAMDGRR
jgi:hypothetical protein